MEPQPGMFVIHVGDGGWVADPEVPGSEMQELVHDGSLEAGTTRILETDGPMTWTPEQREVLAVLEGGVRIEFGDGTSVSLGPGDIGTIPAGMETTWHVTVPIREMWVLAET
ncbi:MAG TPA: cupin domain-containing protein [Actinomycetota bacterium]|nr:cupin domain-containing protein [Actinomycetota bacterium]